MQCLDLKMCDKKLYMRFCGLTESEREAKKQQQKSCLWLMEVVKKTANTQKKNLSLHLAFSILANSNFAD